MAGNGGKRKGAGRPKGVLNKSTTQVKEIAQKYGEMAIKRLGDIVNDDKADARAQIAAAKELLDRAYGKAPQAITDGEGGKLFPDRIEIVLVSPKSD